MKQWLRRDSAGASGAKEERNGRCTGFGLGRVKWLRRGCAAYGSAARWAALLALPPPSWCFCRRTQARSTESNRSRAILTAAMPIEVEPWESLVAPVCNSFKPPMPSGYCPKGKLSKLLWMQSKKQKLYTRILEASELKPRVPRGRH